MKVNNISAFFSDINCFHKFCKLIFYMFILTLISCSTSISKSDKNNNENSLDPVGSRHTKYSYRVKGKTYHPLISSKNYEAQGVASWYGKKFHRSLTSNGERFNMYALTAAHKTLPLPSYVQVTNLANGKKIIVKVNDRGPFINNRLIDLSYVAAKKIGMVKAGCTQVNIKVIDIKEYNKQLKDTSSIHLVSNLKSSKNIHSRLNGKTYTG